MSLMRRVGCPLESILKKWLADFAAVAESRGPAASNCRQRLFNLIGGREGHFYISLRQLGEQVSRDDVTLLEVIEAYRLGVALQPEELAFVRVQEFLPQASSHWMRCVGIDCL